MLSEWESPPAGGLFQGIVPEPLWLILGANGYADRLIALRDLGPMETRTLNLSLKSSMRVPGYVRTEAGAPCAEARVRLIRDGVTLGELKSNALGRFCFEGIRRGPIHSFARRPAGVLRVLQNSSSKRRWRCANRELQVPDGFWLRGLIRSRNLEHIEHCEVHAQLANRERPQFQRAEISSEGEFRVGPFTNGEVRVRLALPDSQFMLDLGTRAVGPEAEACFFDLFKRVPAELLVRIELPNPSYAGVTVEAQLANAQRVSLSVDSEGRADFGFVPPAGMSSRSVDRLTAPKAFGRTSAPTAFRCCPASASTMLSRPTRVRRVANHELP